MKSTRDITIAKLKKQPKHGATGFDDLGKFLESVKKINKSGDLQTITDQLDATKAGFINLEDAIDASTNAVKAVITETDKLSAGYGRISTVQQQYQQAVIKQIKNTTALEEANAELNKTLKMSSARAFDFSKGLRGLNKEVEGQRKRINLSDASLFKYAKTLNGITGGLSSFSKKFQDADGNITAVGENLLRTQGYLQQNLGMTEEQAAAFEMYAGGMKMSGQQAVAQLGDLVDSLTKVGAGFYEGADAAQLQSQIVGDIAEAGEVIQLQYSKMPGNLEVASLKARALGTTLKQLHSTGEAMLNIESSIGQELEYQALTGHRLLDSQGKSLTNEYRMATIRGDQTRQAELMAKFIKDEGDTLSNNLFARKKAAELMGTDEATLARMIQKQKALADLGMEQIMKLSADDQKTAIEKARKEAEAAGDKDRLAKQKPILVQLQNVVKNIY
jgi:hypothetical protein